jgi:TRAP transporter TAXI family solute receptor
LRAIANLYHEAMHVVVRAESSIRTIADLRGRAVSIGQPLSATRIAARAVLGAAGVPETGVQLVGHGPSDAAEALRNGTIDAYFEMSGGASQTIFDLAGQIAIRLVALDGAMAERLKRAGPFYRDAKIPADAYERVAETATLSLGVLWIVNADVPQEIVHGLTRALFHQNNRAALDREDLGKQIKLATALEGVGLNVHPGAAFYYFEAGVDRGLVERAGQQQPAQP